MRVPSALAAAVDEQYRAIEGALNALRSGDPETIKEALLKLNRANAERSRLT